MLAAVLLVVSLLATGREAFADVAFDRIVLDPAFRAEGVAVADVNGDGTRDILAGNLWYEAPAWTPHTIRPVETYDPATGYSICFLSWATDISGDGLPDQLVVGLPGNPGVWRENPGASGVEWTEYPVWPTIGNESPAFAPIARGGDPVLIAGIEDDTLAWLAPGPDPRTGFVATPISASGTACAERFHHGLGIADLDGDRRPDVVCEDGYFRGPRRRRLPHPWRRVPIALGNGAAQLAVVDVNGDGRRDVISSSPHGVGIWWWERRPRRRFRQHVIDESFSQSHALTVADVNADGLPDVVTGKRFWAHGPTGDVDPNAPALLVWFELRRDGRTASWVKHVIDDDSGVGTQVVATDVDGDGRVDVVVANKKGVFFFRQR